MFRKRFLFVNWSNSRNRLAQRSLIPFAGNLINQQTSRLSAPGVQAPVWTSQNLVGEPVREHDSYIKGPQDSKVKNQLGTAFHNGPPADCCECVRWEPVL